MSLLELYFQTFDKSRAFDLKKFESLKIWKKPI